jgi:hypothetical protein
MSDHSTILIPDAPNYVPSPEAQRQAVALFREIAFRWRSTPRASRPASAALRPVARRLTRRAIQLAFCCFWS